VPLSLPDARYLLSGENETEYTLALCPFRVAISFLYSTLQIFTFLSSLPEAIYLPLGENATD
jgi:hypothetical protein